MPSVFGFVLAGLGQRGFTGQSLVHDCSPHEFHDAMLAQDNLSRVASRIDPMCRYETSIVI